MTDLRQAAQQALEALEGELLKMLDKPEDEQYRVRYAYLLTVITALRTALAAQPQQEPVAWMFEHSETGRMNYVSNDGMHTPELFLKTNLRYALVCPLYAAPPQRPWQGLTDEYLAQIDTEEIYGVVGNHMAIAMAVEAVLKEKNG